MDAPPRLVLGDRRRRHDELRAALYEPLLAPVERLLFGELRSRALDGLHGRGAEIGIGTGLSLGHYPAGVELIGVEVMREMAALAAARPPSPLAAVVIGRAEAIPFPDQCFDFVVGQFVLCSVDDRTRALGEMHRVLHRGGELRLVEHVRSSKPLIGGVQDRLAPWWSGVAYGCRLNDDIEPLLAASRFTDLRIDRSCAGMLRLVRARA
jgi:SAM-dependent methyltransferase